MLSVYWSPLAEETYGETLDYLSQEWGNFSAIKFMDKVEKMLVQISRHPYMYKASQVHPTIRKGLVTKHTTLVYEVKTDRIELLAFWSNRMEFDEEKF